MGRTYTLQAVDPLTGRPVGPARQMVTPEQLAQDPYQYQQVAPAEAEPDPYPADGDEQDVLAWVGYRPDRAKAAIVAEHGREQPRAALLAELEQRTG